MVMGAARSRTADAEPLLAEIDPTLGSLTAGPRRRGRELHRPAYHLAARPGVAAIGAIGAIGAAVLVSLSRLPHNRLCVDRTTNDAVGAAGV